MKRIHGYRFKPAAAAGVLLAAFASLAPATILDDTMEVRITAPASGATVSGTVTVTATVNVIGSLVAAGVMFFADNVAIGPEDTTPPYSISWNTTAATAGSHRLVAVARDVTGLVRSSSPPVDVTVSNDTIRPAVTVNQASGQPDPARVSPIRFAVVFSEAVTDFTAADVTVGGTAGGTAQVTGGPSTYEVAVSGMANGSVMVTIPAGGARDAAGNPNTASTSTDNSVTFDAAAPAVTINQAAGQPDPTGASPIQFTVVFSEPVSGFASADVALSGSAGGTRTVAVSGGPSTYAVAVSGMTSGTVTASVVAGAAADAAGNASAASTSSDDTVTFDGTAPTVTVDQAAGQPDPATASPILFTVAFSEPVSGFAAGDVAIGGTAGGTKSVAVSGGPATYEVAVSGMADGTVTASVPAGAAQDAVGNASAASTSTDNTVTFATPTVTVRVQDGDAAIAYTGSWVLGSTARSWSGGTAAMANGGPSATGTPTRATLSFQGTSVSWIGFRGPQTGIARVFLDGALVATVDCYAAQEQLEAVLYASGTLTAGPHTVAVENTGTKNALSSDILVILDAFDLTRSAGPDTTAPAVSVTSPSHGATVTGTVSVSAGASDDVGVAGVQLLLDGAPLGPEDTTAPYGAAWDTTSVADGPYTLTATARDAAGNTSTSAAVSVTVANTTGVPTAGATRFENTEPTIVYTDGTPAAGRPDKWWHGSRSRGWSGATSAFNRSQGARATFTFTGTGVRWIGFRAHWAGIARVSLDGAPFTEIDLFSAPDASDRLNGEKAQAVVYAATELPHGAHTLVVESTGRKRGGDACDAALDPANCASDWAVVVDAFDVLPSVAPPVAGARLEETSATMTAGTDGTAWAAGDPSQAWSGGSALANAAAGARATFTFTGTSVRWIGFRGPGHGIARVYLDGSAHADIDTYSPLPVQAAAHEIAGLAPARHTLVIEATGLRNAASSGAVVVVDGVDIHTRFENQDPAVAYTGAWNLEDFQKAWSGTYGTTGSGTAALGRTAGDQAVFRFQGTEARWIGYRGPLAGLADVYVDDALVGRVDLYAPVEQVQAEVFATGSLPDGPHTLRILVTGEKNPAAGAAIVIVDAFDVSAPAAAAQVTRVQENDPAVTYTNPADWTRGSRFPFDSGEFSMGSHASTGTATAGTKATYRFRGTSVRVLGRRGFSTGVARISLDGVLVATVDTQVPVASQEEFQAVLYAANGLAAGVDHTLEVELSGRNGEPAGAPVPNAVWLDAFDIY